MEGVHMTQPLPLQDLEPRKIAEIEHSRKRRSILQGSERHSDTNKDEQADGLDHLIRDKEAFKVHFSNIKFYSVTYESEKYLHSWLSNHCKPGTKVIDFACGNGENGIYAAKCGADVIGIDISPEGVENSNINAQEAGVNNHCRFEVMDGERMSFPESTFDLGVEYGALHHVDLDVALAGLRRVLKPGAKMICVEALRHNPLIHAYRRRTPHLRTAWEVDHILGVESLEVMKKHFGKIEVRFFHLMTLAAVPLRKTLFFKPFRWILDRIDRIILSNKLIGKYAWIMIVVMSDPIKNNTSK